MGLINCVDCGKEVSENADACPNCGSPIKQENAQQQKVSPVYQIPQKPKKKKGLKIVLIIIIAIIVFIIVLGVIGSFLSDDDKESSTTNTATSQSSNTSNSSARNTPAPEVVDLRPQSQIQFETVIDASYEEFKNAANEIQQSVARKSRTKALADLQLGLTVKDWVGTISTLSTNNDGHGVIVIKLNRNLSVSTWNNAFSDIGDTTLISSDSPLFDKLLSLSKGDKVKFSGTFFKDDEDYYRTKAMTIRGSMKDPDFLMRFTDISPIN